MHSTFLNNSFSITEFKSEIILYFSKLCHFGKCNYQFPNKKRKDLTTGGIFEGLSSAKKKEISTDCLKFFPLIAWNFIFLERWRCSFFLFYYKLSETNFPFIIKFYVNTIESMAQGYYLLLYWFFKYLFVHSFFFISNRYER